jgi:hypothetical protein
MLVVALIGVGVFFADLLAVAAIAGSLWLERRLGLSRGMLLDWILIIAVSYGVAAWISGELLKRGMLARAERTAVKEAQNLLREAETLAQTEARKLASLAIDRHNRLRH